MKKINIAVLLLLLISTIIEPMILLERLEFSENTTKSGKNKNIFQQRTQLQRTLLKTNSIKSTQYNSEIKLKTKATGTISISSPTDGSTVSGTITVSGSFSSSETSNTIELYVDNSFVDSQNKDTTSGSYSFSLDTTQYSDGQHTITVKLYYTYLADKDGDGIPEFYSDFLDDDSVTVIFDNKYGSISISSPTDGSTVSGTITVSGSFSSSETSNTIKLYVDSSFVSSQDKSTSSGSYSFSLDTTQYSDGQHTITVKLYSGTTLLASDSVSVTFDNIYVKINSPTDGSTVSGTISITGEFSNTESSNTLELYLDSQFVDSQSFDQPSGTYSFSLDTYEYSNGQHTITVKLYYVYMADKDHDDIPELYSELLDTSSVTVTFSNYASVTIDAPNDGDTLRGVITVSGSYSASTSDVKLELYLDGTLIGSQTKSSSSGTYSFSLNTTKYSDGSHTIEVRIYTGSVQRGSDSVSVTFDNIYIYIHSPSDGSTVSGTITVSGNFSSTETSNAVELYIDSQLVDSQSFDQPSGTYSFSLDTYEYSNGQHTITVKLYYVYMADKDHDDIPELYSELLDTSSVTVTFSNYASVTIDAPNDGDTLRGVITVSGSYSASTSDVKLELYLDGTLIGSQTKSSSSGTYSFSLNTTKYSDGSHTIEVRIYTGSVQRGSDSVSVTFDNIYVTIDSPINGSTVSGIMSVEGTYQHTESNSVLELYVDDNLVDSVSRSDNSGTYSFSLNTSSFDDGFHTITVKLYYFEAQDTDGDGIIDNFIQRFLASDSVVIIFDNSPPLVYVNITNDINGYAGYTLEIEYSAEDSLSEPCSYSYEILKSGALVKSGDLSPSGSDTIDISDLGEGDYILIVYATDSMGNTGRSRNISFSVDRSGPIVHVEITNSINGYVGFELNISYDGNDVETGICNFTTYHIINETGHVVDSGTLNSTGNMSIEINLLGGSYTIVVFAVDAFGNEGSGNTTFMIDRQAPILQVELRDGYIVSVSNGSKVVYVTNSSSITLYWLATDNTGVIDNVTIIVNETEIIVRFEGEGGVKLNFTKKCYCVVKVVAFDPYGFNDTKLLDIIYVPPSSFPPIVSLEIAGLGVANDTYTYFAVQNDSYLTFNATIEDSVAGVDLIDNLIQLYIITDTKVFMRNVLSGSNASVPMNMTMLGYVRLIARYCFGTKIVIDWKAYIFVYNLNDLQITTDLIGNYTNSENFSFTVRMVVGEYGLLPTYFFAILGDSSYAIDATSGENIDIISDGYSQSCVIRMSQQAFGKLHSNTDYSFSLMEILGSDIAEDIYYLRINYTYAYMKYFLVYSSDWWVIYDVTKPVVEISFAPGCWAGEDEILVANSSVISFSIYDNSTGREYYSDIKDYNITVRNTAGSSTQFIIQGTDVYVFVEEPIVNETYRLLVTAVDKAGNSESVEYIVDVTTDIVKAMINAPQIIYLSNYSVLIDWSYSGFMYWSRILYTEVYVTYPGNDVILLANITDPFNTSVNVSYLSVDGLYMINIIIYDILGLSEGAETRIVFDHLPPVVSISGISNNSILGGENATCFVEIDINDTSPHKVLVYINGTLTDEILVESDYVVYTLDFSSTEIYARYIIEFAAVDHVNLSTTKRMAITVDTKPPTITTLILPANNSIVNEIHIYWEVYDESGIDEYYLVANGEFYYGNNITISAPDIYIVEFHAVDVLGNIMVNGTYFFSIDATPPSIEIVTPQNNSWVGGTFNLTLIMYDENLYYVEVYIDNSTQPNITCNDTILSAIISIDGDGKHVFKIVAGDRANNTATTRLIVYCDLHEPIIMVNSPLNNTVYGKDVYVDVDIIEENLKEFYIKIDETTYNTTKFNVTLDSGEHVILIYASDYAGNVVYVTILITVDADPPVLSEFAVNDRNETYIFNESIQHLRLEVSEQSNVLVYLDDILIVNETNINGTYEISLAELNISIEDGIHNITIVMIDKFGNSATQTVRLIVDRTKPDLRIIGLNNNTEYHNTTIPITIKASDNVMLVEVDIFVNDMFYLALNGSGSVELALQYNEEYWIRFVAYDIANNTNIVVYRIHVVEPSIEESEEGEYTNPYPSENTSVSNEVDERESSGRLYDLSDPMTLLSLVFVSIALTAMIAAVWLFMKRKRRGIALALIFIFLFSLQFVGSWAIEKPSSHGSERALARYVRENRVVNLFQAQIDAVKVSTFPGIMSNLSLSRERSFLSDPKFIDQPYYGLERIMRRLAFQSGVSRPTFVIFWSPGYSIGNSSIAKYFLDIMYQFSETVGDAAIFLVGRYATISNLIRATKIANRFGSAIVIIMTHSTNTSILTRDSGGFLLNATVLDWYISRTYPDFRATFVLLYCNASKHPVTEVFSRYGEVLTLEGSPKGTKLMESIIRILFGGRWYLRFRREISLIRLDGEYYYMVEEYTEYLRNMSIEIENTSLSYIYVGKNITVYLLDPTTNETMTPNFATHKIEPIRQEPEVRRVKEVIVDPWYPWRHMLKHGIPQVALGDFLSKEDLDAETSIVLNWLLTSREKISNYLGLAKTNITADQMEEFMRLVYEMEQKLGRLEELRRIAEKHKNRYVGLLYLLNKHWIAIQKIKLLLIKSKAILRYYRRISGLSEAARDIVSLINETNDTTTRLRQGDYNDTAQIIKDIVTLSRAIRLSFLASYLKYQILVLLKFAPGLRNIYEDILTDLARAERFRYYYPLIIRGRILSTQFDSLQLLKSMVSYLDMYWSSIEETISRLNEGRYEPSQNVSIEIQNDIDFLKKQIDYLVALKLIYYRTLIVRILYPGFSHIFSKAKEYIAKIGEVMRAVKTASTLRFVAGVVERALREYNSYSQQIDTAQRILDKILTEYRLLGFSAVLKDESLEPEVRIAENYTEILDRIRSLASDFVLSVKTVKKMYYTMLGYARQLDILANLELAIKARDKMHIESSIVSELSVYAETIDYLVALAGIEATIYEANIQGLDTLQSLEATIDSFLSNDASSVSEAENTLSDKEIFDDAFWSKYYSLKDTLSMFKKALMALSDVIDIRDYGIGVFTYHDALAIYSNVSKIYSWYTRQYNKIGLLYQVVLIYTEYNNKVLPLFMDLWFNISVPIRDSLNTTSLITNKDKLDTMSALMAQIESDYRRIIIDAVSLGNDTYQEIMEKTKWYSTMLKMHDLVEAYRGYYNELIHLVNTLIEVNNTLAIVDEIRNNLLTYLRDIINDVEEGYYDIYFSAQYPRIVKRISELEEEIGSKTSQFIGALRDRLLELMNLIDIADRSYSRIYTGYYLSPLHYNETSGEFYLDFRDLTRFDFKELLLGIISYLNIIYDLQEPIGNPHYNSIVLANIEDLTYIDHVLSNALNVFRTNIYRQFEEIYKQSIVNALNAPLITIDSQYIKELEDNLEYIVSDHSLAYESLRRNSPLLTQIASLAKTVDPEARKIVENDLSSIIRDLLEAWFRTEYLEATIADNKYMLLIDSTMGAYRIIKVSSFDVEIPPNGDPLASIGSSSEFTYVKTLPEARAVIQKLKILIDLYEKSASLKVPMIGVASIDSRLDILESMVTSKIRSLGKWYSESKKILANEKRIYETYTYGMVLDAADATDKGLSIFDVFVVIDDIINKITKAFGSFKKWLRTQLENALSWISWPFDWVREAIIDLIMGIIVGPAELVIRILNTDVAKMILSAVYLIMKMGYGIIEMIGAMIAWFMAKAIEGFAWILGNIIDFIIGLFPLPEEWKNIVRSILKGTFSKICQWASDLAMYSQELLSKAAEDFVSSLMGLIQPFIGPMKDAINFMKPIFASILWITYYTLVQKLMETEAESHFGSLVTSLASKFVRKLGHLTLALMDENARQYFVSKGLLLKIEEVTPLDTSSISIPGIFREKPINEVYSEALKGLIGDVGTGVILSDAYRFVYRIDLESIVGNYAILEPLAAITISTLGNYLAETDYQYVVYNLLDYLDVPVDFTSANSTLHGVYEDISSLNISSPLRDALLSIISSTIESDSLGEKLLVGYISSYLVVIDELIESNITEANTMLANYRRVLLDAGSYNMYTILKALSFHLPLQPIRDLESLGILTRTEVELGTSQYKSIGLRSLGGKLISKAYIGTDDYFLDMGLIHIAGYVTRQISSVPVSEHYTYPTIFEAQNTSFVSKIDFSSAIFVTKDLVITRVVPLLPPPVDGIITIYSDHIEYNWDALNIYSDYAKTMSLYENLVGDITRECVEILYDYGLIKIYDPEAWFVNKTREMALDTVFNELRSGVLSEHQLNVVRAYYSYIKQLSLLINIRGIISAAVEAASNAVWSELKKRLKWLFDLYEKFKAVLVFIEDILGLPSITTILSDVRDNLEELVIIQANKLAYDRIINLVISKSSDTTPLQRLFLEAMGAEFEFRKVLRNVNVAIYNTYSYGFSYLFAEEEILSKFGVGLDEPKFSGYELISKFYEMLELILRSADTIESGRKDSKNIIKSTLNSIEDLVESIRRFKPNNSIKRLFSLMIGLLNRLHYSLSKIYSSYESLITPRRIIGVLSYNPKEILSEGAENLRTIAMSLQVGIEFMLGIILGGSNEFPITSENYGYFNVIRYGKSNTKQEIGMYREVSYMVSASIIWPIFGPISPVVYPLIYSVTSTIVDTLTEIVGGYFEEKLEIIFGENMTYFENAIDSAKKFDIKTTYRCVKRISVNIKNAVKFILSDPKAILVNTCKDLRKLSIKAMNKIAEDLVPIAINLLGAYLVLDMVYLTGETEDEIVDYSQSFLLRIVDFELPALVLTIVSYGVGIFMFVQLMTEYLGSATKLIKKPEDLPKVAEMLYSPTAVFLGFALGIVGYANAWNTGLFGGVPLGVMFSSIAWLTDKFLNFGTKENNPLIRLRNSLTKSDTFSLLLNMLSVAFTALAMLADPTLIVIPTPRTFEVYVRSMDIIEPFKTILRIVILAIYVIILALRVDIGLTTALKILAGYVFNKYLKDRILNFIWGRIDAFISNIISLDIIL